MTEPTELTPADLDRLEDLLTPCESGCPSCYGNMDRGFDKKTCRALVAGYRQMLAVREQLAQSAVRAAKDRKHIDSLREQLNVAEVAAGMHVGTCDWGDCDLPTVTVRMSRDAGRLPVCIFHSEAYEMLAIENTSLYRRAEAAEADCAALREVVAGFDCRCDMRFIRECPDCGAPLKAVPEHRYLNSDQWDAIKAGDFFCTGTCTSDVPSRKKYWRYRHLRQYVHGDACSRCAILASPNPGAGLLAKHAADVKRLEGERDGFAADYDHALTDLEQARTRIAELEAELDARLAIRAEYHSHQPRRDREASS